MKQPTKKEKGISLLLTIIIMSIILAMGLGISTIFLQGIRIIRGMGNSVIAFYAADSGIERVLINREAPFNIPITPLPNGATYGAAYQVFVTVGGTGGCNALRFCIKSIGSYQRAKRAIEVTY